MHSTTLPSSFTKVGTCSWGVVGRVPPWQVILGLWGRWRGDLSELFISVGVYVPWWFQMKLPVMWESCINLWLRPPPWGESCHSHCCMPFAANSRASCWLLTEEPHCNVSLYPLLRLSPQEPKPSIITLVTYFGRYRMDERHREIKVILPLETMYSKVWLTGKHTFHSRDNTKKSNQPLRRLPWTFKINNPTRSVKALKYKIKTQPKRPQPNWFNLNTTWYSQLKVWRITC